METKKFMLFLKSLNFFDSYVYENSKYDLGTNPKIDDFICAHCSLMLGYPKDCYQIFIFPRDKKTERWFNIAFVHNFLIKQGHSKKDIIAVHILLPSFPSHQIIDQIGKNYWIYYYDISKNNIENSISEMKYILEGIANPN